MRYTAPLPVSQVIVTSPSQLTGDLQSGVAYLIDGVIDIGRNTINVPSGGLFIGGLGFGVSQIVTSADNATVFSHSDPYAGDLFLYGVEIVPTGSGSRVFDLDNGGNFNAVECIDTNFIGADSLGELTSYRQGLWSNVALIGCSGGLTFSGTWAGGMRATTSILVNGNMTGAIFKAGTDLIMNGRFISDMNALSLPSGAHFCDFAPENMANNASFLMQGVSVNSAANAFPNMPAGSVKARFSKCVGTPNTYIGGRWSITSEVGTSVLAGIPVKLAGTTTYSDMQWFSQSGDNAFVYDGSDTISVTVRVDTAYSAGVIHDVITYIRKWDDSDGVYVDIGQSGPQSMTTGLRVESVSIHSVTSMDTNDRIEVWIESDTLGVVAGALGGLVSISERSS